MAAPEYAIVGRVRRAHGVAGDLVVEPLTDAPDALFASGRRVLAGTASGELSSDGQELVIAGSRPFGSDLIVSFEGIGDRDVAALWRQRYLLVPASELTPLAAGEVYLHDLLHLRVERPSGDVLGEVVDVYDLPHGVLLDVRTTHGSTLLPFRQEFVREVDVARRRLVADPPDGLFD
jgi:16S rRNA processing protein RimM